MISQDSWNFTSSMFLVTQVPQLMIQVIQGASPKFWCATSGHLHLCHQRPRGINSKSPCVAKFLLLPRIEGMTHLHLYLLANKEFIRIGGWSSYGSWRDDQQRRRILIGCPKKIKRHSLHPPPSIHCLFFLLALDSRSSNHCPFPLE